MFLTIQEKSQTKIKFTLSQTTVAFANSLRRTLISDVPMNAASLVEIEKNFTNLPDEVISHRIGLIPIKSTKVLRDPSQCDCQGGCENCSHELVLDVHCTENSRDVVSGDFNDDLVANNDILLLTLKEGHSIKLKATVRRGTAHMHAQYMPCVVTYNYDPENRSRHTKYRVEESMAEWPGISEEQCDFEEPDEVFMGIEVVNGQIDPAVLLYRALDVLKEKLVRIKKEIEEV